MRWVFLAFLAACGGGAVSDPCASAIDLRAALDYLRAAGPGRTGVSDMTDAEGNVYLTGSTATAVAPRYANRGAYDPFVMRFNAGGTLTGTWQGGSVADEEPTDSCGPIVIAGWTEGTLAGPGSSGRRDAFLLAVELHGE